MATVARMPATNENNNNNNNGKPPASCAAESALFVDNGIIESNDSNNNNAQQQQQQQQLYHGMNGGWQGDEHYRMGTGNSGNTNVDAVTSSGHQATSTWQNHYHHHHQQHGYLGEDTQKQGGISEQMSTGAPGLTSSEDSTRSMQEIFESDDFPTTTSSNDNINNNDINTDQSENDEWFNGDTEMLSGKDERKMSTTPPLSLYAGATRKPDTQQQQQQQSYLPAKWSTASSSMESGAATPTSRSSNNDLLNEGSSVSSSNGSMYTPRGNSMTNPILYSAIGSLENPNAISVESFSKRMHNAPVKGFVGRAPAPPPSLLIPPINNNRQFQQQQSDRTVQATNRQAPSSTTQQGNSNHHQTSSRRSTQRTENSSALTKDNRNDSKNDNRTLNSKVTTASAATVSKESQTTTTTSSNAEEIIIKQRRTSTGDVKSRSALKPSNLRTKGGDRADNNPDSSNTTSTRRKSKRVSYNKHISTKKPVEMFRPSCDAYTPRIEKKSIKYRAAEMRTPVQKMATPMGTLQRPNFRDALRRVAMIIHQHIVKIERRFEVINNGRNDQKDNGLFKQSMKDTFDESNYCTPTYKCTMVRIPMARPGMVYGLKKMKTKQEIPSEEEIYEFGHQLFKAVQLSSECSIVCLIYVERLMEAAKVPLLACTWRPIFMCGLLLASKVWQDLSSWNIEFASVYPQYSLDAINRLELNFLRMVKWDLYISSSLYAKYYFALRALVEKVSFRQRYNRMVGGVDSVAQVEALKIQKRTEQVKEEALLQLSRSM